ncbi:spore germination protein KC [Paenibacillus endophyticus]|uniref:Spore germination protein KC n=1 Tax=Paenibacillus endophyticus TaxID=1294268 RepID=A0A7W5GDC7_9BACL|nr:Ger(x)C family spore germination protein [Paenibacillus endophyticus]MBB3155318.1 spore germination protein KC [Paenibacillus endophyticus]
MNKRNKLFLGIWIAALPFLLSGCWDNVELNKTSLITGAAFEPGSNGKIRLTIETMIADQLEGNKDTVPSVLQSAEGNTLSEILIRFNESMDRTLLISHVGVIIIDERLAKQGLLHLLDPMQRTRFIREDILILISKDVPASHLLKVLYPRGTLTSSKITSQVKSYRISYGGIPESRLFDISEALLSEGRELALGAISLKGSFKDANTLQSIKSVTPKASIVIAGTGVFSEDRLLGFLSLEDSRMLSLARNQVKGTTISIPNHDNTAIRLYHLHASLHAEMEKGELVMRMNLEGDGTVGSVDESIRLTSIGGYEQLERLGAEYLEKQMSATIKGVQRRFGVDIFGFGEQMYRKQNAQFMSISGNWNERFARTPVKVKAKIKLYRSELKTNHIRNEGIGP